MMTVRFPNGQAVQYNSATWAEYKAVGIELYEGRGGRWVATIMASAGVILEIVPACSVRNDAEPKTVYQDRRVEVVRPRLPKNIGEIIDVLARGGKPKRKRAKK